jgi:hypothetical protein
VAELGLGTALGERVALGVGVLTGLRATLKSGRTETSPSTVTVTVVARLLLPSRLQPVKGWALGSAAVTERLANSPHATGMVLELRTKS